MPKIIGVFERANKRYWPGADGMYEDLAEVFVAREGAIGDWAAYSGIVKWNEWDADPESCKAVIAEYGDKISKAEACAIFPNLSERPYRE